MGENLVPIVILCVVGAIMQGTFIRSEYRRNMMAAVVFKGVASLIFVTVGYIGFLAVGGTELARFILSGLILGAVGDVLLNARYLAGKKKVFFFVIGTVSFFAGHVMYLAALIRVSENLYIALAAGAVVTVIVCVITGFKTIAALPLKMLGGIYIAAVVFMACVAVVNAVSACSTGRILYAAGAVLFLASDIILILNTFGKKPQMFWSAVCLSLYYPGQILIALAVGYGLMQ